VGREEHGEKGRSDSLAETQPGEFLSSAAILGSRPSPGVDRRGGIPETARVSAEQVALIPRCAEREAAWLPADEERWRAYLGRDDLDEPGEVVLYCPECAEREFGDD
jgi:hypothetical protein